MIFKNHSNSNNLHCTYTYYTHIHNWPLQTFSLDYDLASYLTPLSLTLTPIKEIEYFRETFSWQVYLKLVVLTSSEIGYN